jgi:fatty acid desaturase
MSTLKGVIKPSELAPFLKPRDGLNATLILALYGVTFSFIYLDHLISSWWFTFPAMLLMGAIQHTIATFVHEAAHGHLFSNRFWNERLGQFFFAAPLASYLEDYRYFHWEHHRHTGKRELDPEKVMYEKLGLHQEKLSHRSLIKLLMRDLLGINYIRSLGYLMGYFQENRRSGHIPKPGLYEHATIFFWIILLPALMWKLGFFLSFLFVWVIPMITISPTLLRWHGYGEHIRGADRELHENTLTHKFNWIEDAFLYPINSAFHLEHHLYPQLPWHALRKFRRWAEKRPAYQELASQNEVTSYFLGERSVLKRTLLD